MREGKKGRAECDGGECSGGEAYPRKSRYSKAMKSWVERVLGPPPAKDTKFFWMPLGRRQDKTRRERRCDDWPTRALLAHVHV